MPINVAPAMDFRQVQDLQLAGILQNMYQHLAQAINKLGTSVAGAPSGPDLSSYATLAQLSSYVTVSQLLAPTVSDFTSAQHDHSLASKAGFISPLALKGLNVQVNQLGADVTMTNANTWYDGPSLTLGAGIWLLCGNVQVGGSIYYDTAKLWDGGSNVYATSEQGGVSAGLGGRWSIHLFGVTIPALTGPTTIRISVARTVAGGVIQAACPDNPAGNTASYLIAIQIG